MNNNTDLYRVPHADKLDLLPFISDLSPTTSPFIDWNRVLTSAPSFSDLFVIKYYQSSEGLSGAVQGIVLGIAFSSEMGGVGSIDMLTIPK